MLRLQIVQRLSYDVQLVDLGSDWRERNKEWVNSKKNQKEKWLTFSLIFIPLIPHSGQLLVHILKLLPDDIEGVIEPLAIERNSSGRWTTCGLESPMLERLRMCHWCVGGFERLTLYIVDMR
jgi:hypothetical protein